MQASKGTGSSQGSLSNNKSNSGKGSQAPSFTVDEKGDQVLGFLRMPSHKSSPKFARKESNEETKAPLKVDTQKFMAPKLDHSGSFVGPTDGDNDNAVMISEMDSPGLNLPT